MSIESSSYFLASRNDVSALLCGRSQTLLKTREIDTLQEPGLKTREMAGTCSISELPRVEILIEDTLASLFFDAVVPERFCYHLPSKAEDMFKSIKLG